MQPNIHCILFDIGNVLLFFDRDRQVRQLAERFRATPMEVEKFFIDSGLMLRYERGGCTTEEVLAAFSRKFRCPLSLKDLIIPMADIFHENTPMTRYLSQVKKNGIRTVILSNTNPLHMDYVKEHYDFLSVPHERIFSYEVGALKPEPAMFHKALECAQVPPEEILYIDDIKAFTDKGQAYGLHSHCYQDHPTFLASWGYLGA